jgi:hypothetical protein
MITQDGQLDFSSVCYASLLCFEQTKLLIKYNGYAFLIVLSSLLGLLICDCTARFPTGLNTNQVTQTKDRNANEK